MENPITLPTLSHFQNGNGFLGSFETVRFAIEPPKEGEITVSIWRGKLCRELSEMEETKPFPETDEGIEDLKNWLLEKARAGL